ncbi:MAG: EF-hand domain-containing protein [Sphingomicrobium sp.]
MARFFAGVVAAFLMLTGAFLIWKGNAESRSDLPPAPPPRLAINQGASLELAAIPDAPEADPKSKEEKRFDRADKDEDGTIRLGELVEPRRKPFAKLDLNRDGKLSFEEWAVKTIDKFKTADANANGGLTRIEYATTAPPPPKKKKCAC